VGLPQWQDFALECERLGVHVEVLALTWAMEGPLKVLAELPLAEAWILPLSPVLEVVPLLEEELRELQLVHPRLDDPEHSLLTILLAFAFQERGILQALWCAGRTLGLHVLCTLGNPTSECPHVGIGTVRARGYVLGRPFRGAVCSRRKWKQLDRLRPLLGKNPFRSRACGFGNV